MQDFRANEANTVSIQGQETRPIYGAYVGMDVHKDTIAAAVALAGREAPVYCGEIANRPSEIGKLAAKLAQAHGGEVILFCYEAGPCGYEVHRQLTALGFDCEVVAPSRIPGAGRADQDRSAGRGQAGAVVAQRGVDAGLGSGRGAGGDAGPGAGAGGLQERRAQDAPATGGVSAAPWSPLVTQSLDAGALRLAGWVALRAGLAGVGVPGISGRSARGE